MTRITPDHVMSRYALGYFLEFFKADTVGEFSITLVKENGQGYNLVLHRSGSSSKIRVAVTETPHSHDYTVDSTWNVRDVIERVLARNGRFAPSITALLDRRLQGQEGSVMLVVKGGTVAEAHFHEGEIWP